MSARIVKMESVRELGLDGQRHEHCFSQGFDSLSPLDWADEGFCILVVDDIDRERDEEGGLEEVNVG